MSKPQPKLGLVYSLMAVALVTSVWCSCAAALPTAPQDFVQRLLAGASLAAFVSIGWLSSIAQRLSETQPAVDPALPLPVSESDRPILGLRAWRAVNCGPTIVLQSWHAQHAYWPAGRALRA